MRYVCANVCTGSTRSWRGKVGLKRGDLRLTRWGRTGSQALRGRPDTAPRSTGRWSRRHRRPTGSRETQPALVAPVRPSPRAARLTNQPASGSPSGRSCPQSRSTQRGGTEVLRPPATAPSEAFLAAAFRSAGGDGEFSGSMAAAKNPSRPKVVWRAAIHAGPDPVCLTPSIGIIVTVQAEPMHTGLICARKAMYVIVLMLAALYSSRFITGIGKIRLGRRRQALQATGHAALGGIPDCTTQVAVHWTAGRVLRRQRRGNEQKHKRHVASHHVEGWSGKESLRFQL